MENAPSNYEEVEYSEHVEAFSREQLAAFLGIKYGTRQNDSLVELARTKLAEAGQLLDDFQIISCKQVS